MFDRHCHPIGSTASLCRARQADRNNIVHSGRGGPFISTSLVLWYAQGLDESVPKHTEAEIEMAMRRMQRDAAP